MEYTHLGRSGLSVSRLCLGTMNFGPLTPPDQAHAIMDHAHELGINFFDTANRYGAPDGPAGQAAEKPSGHYGWTEEIIGDWFAAGAGRRRRPARAHGPRDQALRRDGDLAERRQAVRPEYPPGVRRVAEAAADRLHRPVPDAPHRPRHPVGGDLAGDGGPRRAGQDPLRRLIQLRGLGHRAGKRDRQGARVLRSDQRAVAVQPARPHDRAGGAARGQRLWRRHHPMVAAGRRAARRRAEVRAGGPPPAGRPGEADGRGESRQVRRLRGPVREAGRGTSRRGAGVAAASGRGDRADHRPAHARAVRRRAAGPGDLARRRRPWPARRDLPRIQAGPGALRLVSAQAQAAPLLRDRSAGQRVTNIELFFDLVYVFAVTQLSHYLLREPTVEGAFQTAILLAMVWLAWAYTTWVTNWLDPDRLQVRLLLVALMLVSLAMSVALPSAFGPWGLWVGGAYALMQIGRSVFMVAVLSSGTLRRNYERILVWCIASGALAVGGGR